MIKPVAYMIDEVWAVTEADFEKASILKQHIKDDRAVPLYAIPEGYALVKTKSPLGDGGVAQKAFWHALEFCNDPENRNIRSHWESYKAMFIAGGVK